jgi:hypothetical protein
MSRGQQEAKRLKTLADWENIAATKPEWIQKAAAREGVSIEQLVADKTSRIREPIKAASGKEIAEAQAAYHQALKDFAATNDPHYAQKILAHDMRPGMDAGERKAIMDALAYGEDINKSGGQNVLPVRLRGDKSNIHVKDYEGQGYRDSTYADEMSAAQADNKSGVLFKNTFDPADPHNRVEQDIAAVFEPNQVRSVNAAFDPRFKDSALLLAGQAGTPQAAPLAPMSEAIRKRWRKKEE